MNSSTIVFPIDFSNRCVSASHYVTEWARRFSAPLVALHVVDPKDFSASPERNEDRFYDKLPIYMAKATQDLQFFCDSYLSGVRVQQDVIDGDTALQIVGYSAVNSASAIMIPRDHQSLASRWMHDSVSSRVLETSQSSVWNTEYIGAVRPVQHVLCALEMSTQVTQDAENAKVLRVLKQVATAFAAATTILSVVEEDQEEDLKSRLTSLKAQADGFADVQIVSGNVGDQIKVAASRTRADLIIMGRTSLDSPGLTRQAHILTVNHRTECPVLSVF